MRQLVKVIVTHVEKLYTGHTWGNWNPKVNSKPTVILQSKADHLITNVCLALLLFKSKSLTKSIFYSSVCVEESICKRIWIKFCVQILVLTFPPNKGVIEFWWSFVSTNCGFQISGNIYIFRQIDQIVDHNYKIIYSICGFWWFVSCILSLYICAIILHPCTSRIMLCLMHTSHTRMVYKWNTQL